MEAALETHQTALRTQAAAHQERLDAAAASETALSEAHAAAVAELAAEGGGALASQIVRFLEPPALLAFELERLAAVSSVWRRCWSTVPHTGATGTPIIVSKTTIPPDN